MGSEHQLSFIISIERRKWRTDKRKTQEQLRKYKNIKQKISITTPENNYNTLCKLYFPRMTPRTDPEQLLSEPSGTLRHRETEATPKPPPEREPPPVDRPNSKPVGTRLLTATCGGDSLNGPQAQRRQTNLPASGVYREIYVPAQDPNPRSDRKPDSVEEGDRIISPKAPPTHRTPPTSVPILDVTIVVTRVWGLFRDVTVLTSIGQREYNM